MKTLRNALVAVVVLAVLSLAAVPAFAQRPITYTITLTETDINAWYRVTNPLLRSVSNVVVDLQPEQVVISATITPRQKSPVAVVATLVPSISNSRLFWTVTAVTSDGQPVSSDLLNQINASIAASWRNYLKEKVGTGRVTAIDITDDAVILTLTGRR